jgi:peptide/nickel transport system permease protein
MAGDPDESAPAPSRWRDLTAELLASKVTVAGLGTIAVLLLIAAIAPLVSPYDPVEQSILSASQGPSWEHWLGTDNLGRDVFSRVLYGARVSLTLGILAPLLAGVAGSLVGTVAGYFGGRVDRVIVQTADLFMSFPTLLLGIMIAAALGPGFVNVILAISVALFPRFVRLARASAMSVRAEPYVEASIAIGQTHPRIIWRHVLPNISGPMVVMGTLWVATAIRLEATLSFLGLGTQPPSPSWGNMVRDGMQSLLGSPLPTISAGLAITLSVLAFNMVGDAIRDALDPETQV